MLYDALPSAPRKRWAVPVACPQLVHSLSTVLPPSLQVPEGTAPLQAILRASHLVRLGALTPKTQHPLPLPGSSFRHPLVPRLLSKCTCRVPQTCHLGHLGSLGGCVQTLSAAVPTGKLPARAMDWMQEKAACISIDWPLRSCMMQRDGCCYSTRQSTSPDPARFAKKWSRPPKDRYDLGRCIDIVQRTLFLSCVTYERKRGRLLAFCGPKGGFPLLDAAQITP